MLLFDRTRSLSLHLFEHVHGESRDRGQAMVDLSSALRGGRLDLERGRAAGLPAAVPRVSCRRCRRATPCELLGQPAHIFAALAERLRKRESPYAAVFRALVRLAEAKPEAARSSPCCMAEPDPEPNDLAALDAAWEEEAVTFGPGAPTQCCKDRLSAKLRMRAARRPAWSPPRPGPAASLERHRVIPAASPRLRRLPCATPSITSCSAGIPISA